MLVISRRPQESLVVGRDIRVTVLDVRSDQVKLGVEAPRHVPVLRQELLEEVRERNLAALAVQPSLLRRSSEPAEPTPDTYLETESDDLDAFCAGYEARGFRLVQRSEAFAWLMRSQVYLRVAYAARPETAIRLTTADDGTACLLPL